jgi:hypothetical protein
MHNSDGYIHSLFLVAISPRIAQYWLVTGESQESCLPDLNAVPTANQQTVKLLTWRAVPSSVYYSLP